MKSNVLNYLVLIEPDTRMGTDELCYTVHCPTLGLSDSGDTIEEAVEHIRELIMFHLASLEAEGEQIPEEKTEKSLFATVQVPYPHAA